MELDDVLTMLGAWGRYQVFVYLAISIFDNVPSIQHMSIMAFLGYEPTHHCKIPDGATYNKTIPRKFADNEWTTDKCHMKVYQHNSSDNYTLAPCQDGWYYDLEPVQTSIVTDWDLVCAKNLLPETSVMVFNFGVMFGAILFGFLSDKYGRKKSLIFALVTQAIVGSLTSASPNFYIFCILRFIVGALEQGINITGFVMATELFPPKERTIAAVSHEFFWALGGALLPMWAYLFRNWRHLQIAVSLPSILGIVLIWTIPESLVWLIAKGRISEAEEILERASRVNKRPIPPHCLSEVGLGSVPNNLTGGNPGSKEMIDVEQKNSSPHDQRTYTVLDLVRTPNLRKITLCISGLWALNTMVYYGLSYNTPNLYGDMYLNFFIGQMVEIPSVIATLWLIYKVGRRWPLCLFHVFGGLVCIASPFVPPRTASGVDLTWVSVTLAMLGKFSINASFTVIYIYGPEIYPTVVRNTGAGMGSFAGRFGGIVYPYINYLSKLDVGPIGKKLPLMIFGIMSVVGGFLALPLPETRHRPLPETIEDVENYEEFCNRRCNRQHTENGIGE